MSDALTARQREVFDHIETWVVEFGHPPSIREIGEAFGISSSNGVNDHLKALEKKGWIKRCPRQSRGITIIAGPHGALTPSKRCRVREGLAVMQVLAADWIRERGDSDIERAANLRAANAWVEDVTSAMDGEPPR